jgi:Mg/Co/Ni transporter MgtE
VVSERRIRRVLRNVQTEESRRSRKILRQHREEVERILKEESLESREDIRCDVHSDQLRVVWDHDMSDRQSRCLLSLT